MSRSITRRDFVTTGAGLVIAFHLPPRAAPGSSPPPAGTGFAPNAWLRVGADGRVTLTIDKCSSLVAPHVHGRQYRDSHLLGLAPQGGGDRP